MMGNLFSSDTRAKGKTTHTTQDELFSKRANSVQNVATKDNGRSKKQSKTKTPHADRHQKELSKDQSGKTTQTDMCSYESTKGKGRSNKHNKAVNLVPDVKDNGKGQSNKRSETATDQPAGWRQDKPAESTTKINSNHDSVQNAAAKDNGQSEKQSKTKTPHADRHQKELSKDQSGKTTQTDMCSYESTKGKGRSNKHNKAVNLVPDVKDNGKGQSNKRSETATDQPAGWRQDKPAESTTKINSNHDSVQNAAAKDNGQSEKQSKTKTPHADRHQKELSKDQSGKTTQTDMCSYESTKGEGRSNKHNKAVNLVPDVKDNGKGQSNKRSETATDQPAGWRQDKPAESTTKINSNHDSVQNAAAKDNGQSEKQSKTKTPHADRHQKELSKDQSGKTTQTDMCSYESTKGEGRSNKHNKAVNLVPDVKDNGKGQSNKRSETATDQPAGWRQDKPAESTTKINSNHDSVQNAAAKDNGQSEKQSKTKTPHADRHQKELSKDQSGKTTQTDMCSYESTKGEGRSNKHNKAVNLVPDVKDNGKGQSNKRSETATDQPAGWRQDKPAESTTKINSNHDSVQNAAAKDNGQSEKQSKTKTPPADQLKKELSKDESGKQTQIDMCSHESTKGKGRSNKNNEAMNVVHGLNQYVTYNGKGQSNKCSKTVTAQSAGRCQDKATEGKRLTEPTTKINSNHDTGPTTTVQNDNEQNKSKIKEKHKTGNTENEYILLTQKLSPLHDSQFFTARHVLYNVDEMLKKLDQPWPVDDLYARLTKEQEEKSRLLTKLSELAGDRLKNDNPAITDLSDLNRPTKLAERFSEIYDYEWTDVMEFLLEKMDEDCEIEMIKFLLSTIVKCYEVCVDMSTKQIQDISKLFCVSPNQSIEAKDIPKSCKDYQKTMFESSMEYIMTQYRDELLNGNSELFGKQKQLYEAVKYISCYKTYVTKCFKICWHMRIQDPPIFMKSEGGDDPKKVFRAYTQSGPYVDFVVWPALMLYEGGTILYRGVAQYTKAGP